MKRIALLGCGNIGGIIARRTGAFAVSAVYDQDAERRSRLAGMTGASDCPDFPALLSVGASLGGRPELVENLPSPNNPWTGYLAALSVPALIETWDHPLSVGT
jgi:predicted dinucleotide-utilizing enzyme